MIKTPYNWLPELHQDPVIHSEARFKVLVWHRKARKTTLAINELLRWANALEGTYWYVAPQLNQARKIVWEDPQMLQKYCPPEVWATRNSSGLFLTFPNGSKLYILGADNPDSLRGPNPKGVVLDEFDDMKKEIWSAVIHPVMIANSQSWCWFIGTYKSKRSLSSMYEFAKSEMLSGNPDWYANMLKASESNIIAAKDLEDAKRTMPEAFYRQEMECEEIDNAAQVFRNLEACLDVFDENMGIVVPWDGKLVIDAHRRYRVGADLAKFNDYTVITPFDLTTYRVGKPDRFNQVDYTLIKARIELAHLNYLKAETVIDSTGVGEPVYDDLKLRIKNIIPFHFTAESRENLLKNLQILIEKGKIKIPNDENLLNELRSFQYVLVNTTGRGKIKMQVPDGIHDDCVMSLALAVWDIPENPLPPVKTASERETLKQFDFYKNKKSGIFTGSKYLRNK